MKSKFYRIILLIFAASAVGIFYNFISPNKLPLFTTSNSKIIIHLNEINELIKNTNGIYEINSKQAYNLQSDLDIVFVDARDQWEYSKKRISNSINLPEYNFNSEVDLIKYLDKKGFYIIYCSSDDCNLSMMLANKLKKLGFEKLFVLKDGIEGWTENNYPLEGI